MDQATITPMPPVATGVRLPWDQPVDDPVGALAVARATHGDSFVVDSGADRYLFTFSPRGVSSFYGLPEDRASKGVADWRMLRRKLPDRLFPGRRTLPHQLFGRDDVASFLTNVERAVDDALEELGDRGEIDLFDLTSRLGHRVGLASWGGPGASTRSTVRAPGHRLLRPRRGRVLRASRCHGGGGGVRANGPRREHSTPQWTSSAAALGELDGRSGDHPLFTRMVAAWDDEPAPVAARGVAMDVALVHIASMSNLFAALGWAVVDLLEHPAECERVRSGDRSRAEQCALESIRLAQRSIMARYVTEEVTIDVGDGVHTVSPGVTIATLLPLTNTGTAPGFGRWDPDRWHQRRLADPSALAAAELVTAFGHGRHTCPAQPFSLSAMTTSATRLLAAFEWEPSWFGHPLPVRAQIGGVARAATPCTARYRRLEGRAR